MDNKYIIRIKNITPLHIGTGKDTYYLSANELHSDSISAALGSMLASTSSSNIESFLESFYISSGFPYVADKDYLPCQVGLGSSWNDDGYKKELKKLSYLNTDIWNRINNDNVQNINPKWIVSNVNTKILNNAIISQVSQRVSIEFKDGILGSKPFYFDRRYFQSNSGLYFIIIPRNDDFDFETIKKQFIELGNCGIGSDRNVGGGHFNIDENESRTLGLQDADAPNSITVLSSYIPTDKELKLFDLSKSKYELIQRGGYISESDNPTLRFKRKNTVYMFKTGSVLRLKDSLLEDINDNKQSWPILQGCKVNLNPCKSTTDNHKVWRCGFPVTVKTNLQ